MRTHDYSTEWYTTFLDAIPPSQTESEVAFLARHLPIETHLSILDLCCGPGRHAFPLAQRGYSVLGIDSNHEQLSRAAASAIKGVTFRHHDIRDLASLPGRFDGIINLWASFGFFSDEVNSEILRQIGDHLRPGGKAIFDLYNRDCMVNAPACEKVERSGLWVRTERRWTGTRLRVDITYGSGARDEFEWNVYTPVEFGAACVAAGLEPVTVCTGFDDSREATAGNPRMQFVLERR